MKICILANIYSSQAIGGENIYIERISKKLIENNHKIVFIVINHDKEKNVEENGKIKIYRIIPFNLNTFNHIAKRTIIEQGIWTILDIYNYYSYFQIKNILKHEKPDVVHIHTPVDMTLSAFNAVKDEKIPLVFTLHDYLLLCRRIVLLHANGKICCNKNINPLCRIYRNFSKNIVNRTVDTVIAPSRFILELYKKFGFFTESSIFLLSHGIDLKKDEDIPTVKNICECGIDVLYVGSLTKHKGVDILIQAVSKIKSDKIKLHIVGEGVIERDLKKVAMGDKRIIFYGKVKNENIHKFYLMSDILVVPSVWYEVFGIVIQEAFRAGVPVIGSRIGGIPEIIKDDYNGYLFKAGDIGELKDILENIVKNPKKLAVLSRNAYESVSRYEMSKHVDELTSIYEEAIAKNKLRYRY